MGSYPDEFPFNIMDVVELLHLRIRRQQSNLHGKRLIVGFQRLIGV